MLDSNWHKVPNNLRDLLPDRIERDVYEVLLEHSNKDGYSSLSIYDIHRETHLSKPTILKALENLNQKKFIEIQKRRGKKNIYKILSIEKNTFLPQEKQFINKDQIQNIIDYINERIKKIRKEVAKKLEVYIKLELAKEAYLEILHSREVNKNE